ncbi:hypothetical protein BaRGS_00015787, partial [Batillaria attramentaria]
GSDGYGILTVVSGWKCGLCAVDKPKQQPPQTIDRASQWKSATVLIMLSSFSSQVLNEWGVQLETEGKGVGEGDRDEGVVWGAGGG